MMKMMIMIISATAVQGGLSSSCLFGLNDGDGPSTLVQYKGVFLVRVHSLLNDDDLTNAGTWHCYYESMHVTYYLKMLLWEYTCD